MLKFVVLETPLGLFLDGLTACTRLVVDAKCSPHPQYVIGQECRHECCGVKLVVAPVGCDDILDDFFVDVLAEERPTLKQQEHSRRKRVLCVVERPTKFLRQLADGVVDQVLTISRELRELEFLRRSDEVCLQTDLIKSTKVALASPNPTR